MYREFIIQKIVSESLHIKSFYLEPKDNQPLNYFLPGQFLTLKIPRPETDLIRTYTVSSRPGLPYYRITVKREDQGQASPLLHDTLHTGDTLWVRDPAGQFHLNLNSSNPVMMISGGVGITPMLSMLAYIQDKQPNRKVIFIHASRNQEVQPMTAQLYEWTQTLPNFRLIRIHSQPLASEKQGQDFDFQGRINPEILSSHLDTDIEDYYICGPRGFMEVAYADLINLGISPEKIHYEFFGESKKLSPSPTIIPSTEEFTIEFSASGKTAAWTNQHDSILELAESLGLSPDYSCRIGTCMTCESQLLEGKVKYDPEPFVDVPEGSVLICCSQPQSNLKIDI